MVACFCIPALPHLLPNTRSCAVTLIFCSRQLHCNTQSIKSIDRQLIERKHPEKVPRLLYKSTVLVSSWLRRHLINLSVCPTDGRVICIKSRKWHVITEWSVVSSHDFSQHALLFHLHHIITPWSLLSARSSLFIWIIAASLLKFHKLTVCSLLYVKC